MVLRKYGSTVSVLPASKKEKKWIDCEWNFLEINLTIRRNSTCFVISMNPHQNSEKEFSHMPRTEPNDDTKAKQQRMKKIVIIFM